MATNGGRRLSDGAVDALVGLAVFALWVVAIVVLLRAGWQPVRIATYWWSGGLLGLAVALRRARPVLGFWLVVIGTALLFRMGVLTYLQVAPLAIATFAVIRSGRLRWWQAAVPAVLATALLQVHGLLPEPVALWVWETAPWLLESPGVLVVQIWPGLISPLFVWSDPSRLVQSEAIVLAAVALGQVVHRLDQTQAELEDRNAALVTLREAEAQRAVTAERNRIARDLHDVVAHHVTAIVVRSQAAVHVDEPALARETLGWVAREGKEALSATRSLVHVLREDSGAMSTTTPPLPTVLERTANRVTSADLAVRLDVPQRMAPLGQELETAIALIAQEALTNVALHSRADEAVVALTLCKPGRVRLVVSDDGPHAPSPGRREGGNGLRHMAERAETLGGSLDAGCAGAGWRVVAELPVAPRETA